MGVVEPWQTLGGAAYRMHSLQSSDVKARVIVKEVVKEAVRITHLLPIHALHDSRYRSST